MRGAVHTPDTPVREAVRKPHVAAPGEMEEPLLPAVELQLLLPGRVDDAGWDAQLATPLVVGMAGPYALQQMPA